jgi:hypothetical protein
MSSTCHVCNDAIGLTEQASPTRKPCDLTPVKSVYMMLLRHIDTTRANVHELD